MSGLAFMKADNYLDKGTKRPLYSPIGYYVTEKFDGQRAQWVPGKGLFSRYGNPITAPGWFLDFFSGIKIPLDGEVFFGYGKWGLTGICRSKTGISTNNDLWKTAKYLVFDTPNCNHTYDERIVLLEGCESIGKWGTSLTPIWLIKRQKVTSKEMLEEFYQAVLARGGEGVMLNNPSAYYTDGRTDNILKYKPVMDDECIVVGYKPGEGRNSGRLGSFIVHPIEDGTPIPGKQFSIGSGLTDVVRTNYRRTHPIGTIISYCCTEYTVNGKPRFPRYLRICKKQVTSETEISLDNITDAKATPERISPDPDPYPYTLPCPVPSPVAPESPVPPPPPPPMTPSPPPHIMTPSPPPFAFPLPLPLLDEEEMPKPIPKPKLKLKKK